MMVMPSNWSAAPVHYWAGRHPGCVGMLFSPGGQFKPWPWMPYALDNGAFTGFDESSWRRLLWWAVTSETRPLWAAVPDVVGDAAATSENWATYHRVVINYEIPPAFVAQDGHTMSDIPPEAAVIFVGGSTEWKREHIAYWCDNFPRVHVGRINTYKWLRYCADAGAESCDGTGWGRGDKKQLAGLLRFLEEQENEDRVAGRGNVRRRAQPQRRISRRTPVCSGPWAPVRGHHGCLGRG